jgi:soluble lytic murein transglycosylase-like protein
MGFRCLLGRTPVGTPRWRSSIRFGGFVLFVLAASFATSARADIYQYTDKEGVVHFTTAKPNAAGARIVARGDGRKGTALGASQVPPQDRDPARFVRYDEWIRQAASLYQIPVELVRAVIKVESDYDPRAVSSAGARGLMQLMPATAEQLQVKDSHDPRENIFGGVRYLRVLANTFNGDLTLTIAGYNAGEDAVMRHGGVPPFEQTREYVIRVMRFYRRYQSIADIAQASVFGAP